MAKTSFIKDPKRVTLYIGAAEHEAATKRAKELGFTGGFSELVSRLIVQDSTTKGARLARASRQIATA